MYVFHMQMHIYVVVSNILQTFHPYFTPNLGEMIQIDDHIFQICWNHQLEYLSYSLGNGLLTPQIQRLFVPKLHPTPGDLQGLKS